jgi:drug/metabolite transporter (DMT)-like permease
MAAGLLLALLLGSRPVGRSRRLLLPAAASLLVAVSGLVFQIQMEDTTPVLVYLLRILLAPAATWLFREREESPRPLTENLSRAVWVLALAQIMPFPWLCLGTVASGALLATASFPQVALAGLMLELRRDLLKKGDTVEAHNVRFTVQKMDGRRVDKIKVIVGQQSDGEK